MDDYELYVILVALFSVHIIVHFFTGESTALLLKILKKLTIALKY